MGRKQEVAIGIALQTHVLRTCPVHSQLYCDDEQFADDECMGRAFALAVEVVRHGPYADDFHHDPHELTDLLSYTIGSMPSCCPDCDLEHFPATKRPARASLALVGPRESREFEFG